MGGSTTIIVVNADEGAGEIVARVVESAGLDAVRLAPDADLATAVVHNDADAAVLDLGAGNLAALQALRARPEPAAAAARVVVIGTGPANGRLAWQAGADAFLVRPFHARDLQAALADALARPEGDRRAHREAQTSALI